MSEFSLSEKLLWGMGLLILSIVGFLFLGPWNTNRSDVWGLTIDWDWTAGGTP